MRLWRKKIKKGASFLTFVESTGALLLGLLPSLKTLKPDVQKAGPKYFFAA